MIAALLTFAAPLVILALGLVTFLVLGSAFGLLLVPLAPLGLAAGYVYAGLALRGGLVALGGYLALGLGAALLFGTPTQFEDAGVLVLAVAVVVLAGFTAYVGWAGYDVYHLALRPR
ncbi:MAG: hypothetical protein JWM80_3322 [Cyanobacteria bacterium RYN_339]|nr:hypothetical protein [Cyanobacteria bacterium RYN_339]